MAILLPYFSLPRIIQFTGNLSIVANDKNKFKSLLWKIELATKLIDEDFELIKDKNSNQPN